MDDRLSTFQKVSGSAMEIDVPEFATPTHLEVDRCVVRYVAFTVAAHGEEIRMQSIVESTNHWRGCDTKDQTTSLSMVLSHQCLEPILGAAGKQVSADMPSVEQG